MHQTRVTSTGTGPYLEYVGHELRPDRAPPKGLARAGRKRGVLQDRRCRSEAEKATTRKAREHRRTAAKRLKDLSDIGIALQAHGRSFTMALTLSWHALSGGERRHGHKLGNGPEACVKAVWEALRDIARRHGDTHWLAIRAPEYDRRRGLHHHLAVAMPETAWRDVIAAVERITGAPAHGAVTVQGRTRSIQGRQLQGVVAKSACEGWLLQRNTRPGEAGTQDWVNYIAKAKAPLPDYAGQFRRSEDVIALQNAYRRAASKA